MQNETAKRVAHRWLSHEREGIGRPEWAHAEDAVALLDQVPWVTTLEVADHVESQVWLHDVLERGIKEDGNRVSREDLLAEGLSRSVVGGTAFISRQVHETRDTFYSRLAMETFRWRLSLASNEKRVVQGLSAVRDIEVEGIGDAHLHILGRMPDYIWVKFLARIVDLREGRTLRGASWHTKRVADTRKWLLPLLSQPHDGLEAWFHDKLCEAMEPLGESRKA